jgi:FkbM family methyltransferase
MKRFLVGTSLGRFALLARNAIELFREIYSRPESVGTLVNDQLATLLITRMCLPKKGFVDVGAHIGSIISEVAWHDPSIKLYAVEPTPEKFDHLRRTFPNIKLYRCALGEAEGEVTFFVNTKHSGYSSLRKPERAADTVEIKVPLRKLDGLIPSDEIDVIKIDVEGAELNVVRGSANLVARNRPIVMFESASSLHDEPAVAEEAMWRWWEKQNYDIVLPNRVAHDGAGLTLDCFLDAHVYPRRTTNYFAIPQERRIEIRDRARSVLAISAHDTLTSRSRGDRAS